MQDRKIEETRAVMEQAKESINRSKLNREQRRRVLRGRTREEATRTPTKGKRRRALAASMALVLAIFIASAAHAQVCTESYADLTVVIPFDSGPIVYEYGPNHAPWVSFSDWRTGPLELWQAADTALYRAVLSQSLFRHHDAGRITCAQVREVMSIAAESGYQIASAYADETHAYWRALIRDPAVHWSPAMFTLMQWSYVGAWSADQVDRIVGVVTR